MGASTPRQPAGPVAPWPGDTPAGTAETATGAVGPGSDALPGTAETATGAAGPGSDALPGTTDPVVAGMPAEVDAVLARAALFRGLSHASAAELRATMTWRSVPRGHVVFAEGQAGNRLFVILEGKVKISRASNDGRENMLAVLGPADLFGELSLFDPGPRTATATALTDATLASLDHSELRPWLTERPVVALQLLAAMARRLRRTNAAMADLVFTDVPGRVAKALLDLADRFGEPVVPAEPGAAGAVRVTHDLTQEELAQLVGASRETVNKALADFAARGWLRLEGRTVVLLAHKRLVRRSR